MASTQSGSLTGEEGPTEEDRRILEEIVASKPFVGVWYRITDFLIDFYVTWFLLPYNLVIVDNAWVSYGLVAACLVYDLRWRRLRVPLREDFRPFLAILFEEDDDQLRRSLKRNDLRNYSELTLLLGLQVGSLLFASPQSGAAFLIATYVIVISAVEVAMRNFDRGFSFSLSVKTVKEFYKKGGFVQKIHALSKSSHFPYYWVVKFRYLNLIIPVSFILIFWIFLLFEKSEELNNTGLYDRIEVYLLFSIALILMPIIIHIIAIHSRCRNVSKEYVNRKGMVQL